MIPVDRPSVGLGGGENVPRTVKTARARREEILDAAEALIIAKGYQRMTVEDILRQVGIAKGTLYHHFAGKEEILQGIVERQTADMLLRARGAAAAGLAPLPRLLHVLGSLRVEESSPARALTEHFNTTRDADFHLLVLNEMLRLLAPVLAEVISDGVTTGDLSCDDPLGLAEVVITLAGTLLDEGVVTSSAEQRERRRAAVVSTLARCLGVAPDQVSRLLSEPGAHDQQGESA
nr:MULTISPECIES: TetR/AcrR family transcriptional regulator [unclassified Actinomyces]